MFSVPDITRRMFSDLFRIVTDHGLSVPPEVAATFRALGVLILILRPDRS